MSSRILVGDCRLHMAAMDESSVDAVVCDPPYDLTAVSRNGSARTNDPATPFGRHNLQPSGGFMGMKWDGTGVAFDPETWIAAARVLKPGGHLLAFGGTRTYHRMAVAIEDAGVEIRDCIAWIYGSGFPKSRNLDGEWDGWGTALKPAMEPIVVARKPLRGTVAANVAAHGTGALNIDGCRIDLNGERQPTGSGDRRNGAIYAQDEWTRTQMANGGNETSPLGRWPANVILDEGAAVMLDAQTGTLTSGDWSGHRNTPKTKNTYGAFASLDETPRPGDSGGASRFFYCAKADRTEREIGMDGVEAKPLLWSAGEQAPGTFQAEGTNRTARNNHPTVKPISLMQWLVRLVTPPGGIVLDPFMGSGTTGIACSREGFDFIGIELSAEYAEIARRRIIGDAPMFAEVDVA